MLQGISAIHVSLIRYLSGSSQAIRQWRHWHTAAGVQPQLSSFFTAFTGHWVQEDALCYVYFMSF
jgi:hypothetical protein